MTLICDQVNLKSTCYHFNINILCHYTFVNVPGGVLEKLSFLSLIVDIEKKQGQFAKHAGTLCQEILSLLASKLALIRICDFVT